MAEDIKDGRVHVSIRLRPPNVRELSDSNYTQAVEMDCKEKRVCVRKEMGDKRTFIFDNLFDQQHTTNDVWNLSCKSIVTDVINGFNGCIMMYGQTGSGKSFTMSNTDTNNRGIIFRAIEEIFGTREADAENEYTVELSYIQIYCEMIQDLLNPDSSNLPVREREDGSVYVQNVTVRQVQNVNDCIKLFDEGNLNRTTANTMMNAVSSRSHACLTIYVTKSKRMTEEDYKKAEQGDTESNGKNCSATHGKLVLVDLAGSERMKKCFAPGTMIMMSDGSSKAVENIRDNDLVMGDDFTPRTVMECVTGVDQMYKIIIDKDSITDTREGFPNPTGYECNEGHPVVVLLPGIKFTKEAGNVDGTGEQWVVEYIISSLTSLTKVRRAFDSKEEAEFYKMSFADDLNGLDDTETGSDGNQDESGKKFVPPNPETRYQIFPVENLMDLDPDILSELKLVQRVEINGEYCERTFGFKIEKVEGLNDYVGFSLDGNRKFLLEDGTVVHNTGATDMRATEGKAINLSLTALGNVIHALSDPIKFKHVPYRDSKLTRLLSDSIGGNSKTSLVICISPAEINSNETINSLAFGDRAMKVTQKAKVNADIDYKTLARKLQARLDKIDEEIAQAQADLLKERKLKERAIEQRNLALKRADLAEDKLRQLIQVNALDFDVDKELGPRVNLEHELDTLCLDDDDLDASMNESYAVPTSQELLNTSAATAATTSNNNSNKSAGRNKSSTGADAATKSSGDSSKDSSKKLKKETKVGSQSKSTKSSHYNIKKGDLIPIDVILAEGKKVGIEAGNIAAEKAESIPIKQIPISSTVITSIEKCSAELEKQQKIIQQSKQKEAGMLAKLKAQREASFEFIKSAVINNEEIYAQKEEELKSEILELKQQLEDKELNIVSLQETIDMAEAQLEEIDQENTNRMIELTSQLTQAKEDARDARDEIAILERDIERHEDEIADLKDEIVKLNQTCSDYEIEKTKLETAIENENLVCLEKDTEIEQLNRAIETINEDKDSLTERVENLEMEIDDLNQQLEATKDDTLEAQTELEEIRKKMEELEDTNADLEAENVSLTRELETQTTLKEEAQAKIVDLQKAITTASAAAETSENTTTELSLKLVQSESKISDLSSSIAAMAVGNVVDTICHNEVYNNFIQCLADTINVLKTLANTIETDPQKTRGVWCSTIHTLVNNAKNIMEPINESPTLGDESKNVNKMILGKISKDFVSLTDGIANELCIANSSESQDQLENILLSLGTKNKVRNEKQSCIELVKPLTNAVDAFEYPACGSVNDEATVGQQRWNRLDETYAKRVVDSINNTAQTTAITVLEGVEPIESKKKYVNSLKEFIISTKRQTNILDDNSETNNSNTNSIPLYFIKTDYEQNNETLTTNIGTDLKNISSEFVTLVKLCTSMSKSDKIKTVNGINLDKLKDLSKDMTNVVNKTKIFVKNVCKEQESLDEAHAALYCSLSFLFRMSKIVGYQNTKALENVAQIRQLSEAYVVKASSSRFYLDEITALRKCFQKNIETQKADALRRKQQEREKRRKEKAVMVIQRFIRNIWNENTLRRFEDRINKVEKKNIEIEREKKQLEALQVETGELILRQGVTQMEQLIGQLLDYFTEPKSLKAASIKKERIQARKQKKKHPAQNVDAQQLIVEPQPNIVAPQFKSLTSGDNPLFVNPLFKK